MEKSSDGGLRTILLSGEAGIVKTRLAEELLHGAVHQGIRTGLAACYSAEGQVAFGPLTDWLKSMPLKVLDSNQLAEVSRLLPELRNDSTPPSPMTENWQSQIFFGR